MVRVLKVDSETEVGLIIVLRQHRTRKLAEITQNNDHYAVQGHSRSPILVPIESSYDFLLVIDINLPPILHRFRDIAFDRSKIAIFYLTIPLAFNPSPRWKGSLHHIIVSDISLKTRRFGVHFCRRQFGNMFNHFYAVRPECYRFR